MDFINDGVVETSRAFTRAEHRRLDELRDGRGTHFDPELLDEFRRSLLRELDYRQEAQNLALLKRNLSDFDRIVVPAPVDDYRALAVRNGEFLLREAFEELCLAAGVKKTPPKTRARKPRTRSPS